MIKNTDNKNLSSKNYNKIEANEQIEDVTKYGEFVSSYFAWVGLEKQKEVVNKIENITKPK